MNILGEITPNKGFIKASGLKSYKPQESWIFNGTIRQNIIFGERFNKQKYEKVLKACCFEQVKIFVINMKNFLNISSINSLLQDLENFSNSDQSFVGEKGLMLSGGQKARISLARAIYRDADLYILDDPFSALDKKVAKNVMNKCILDYLKGKTTILVTHQTQFLLHADRVFTLKNGNCTIVEKEKILSVDVEDENEIPLNLKESKGDDEELSKTGLSGFKTYIEYFKNGSLSLFFLYLFLFIFTLCMKIYLDETVNDFGKENWNNSILISIIIIISLIVLLETGRQFAYHINISLCSLNLHNKMFFKVMLAPMQFFQINPKGRILNRFSRDLGFIDSLIHIYLELVILVPGGMLVSIGLAMSSVPITIIPTGFALAFLWYVMIKITVYASELKRIEAVSANPIYEILDNALRGFVTIRCFHKKKHFLRKMFYNLNYNAFTYYTFQAFHLLAANIYFLTAVLLEVITSLLCIYMSTPEKAFLIGLAISYMISLVAAFDYSLRMFALFDGAVRNFINFFFFFL